MSRACHKSGRWPWPEILDRPQQHTRSSASAGSTCSAGLWLTPPRQRMNSMATSAMSIIAMPSCPAPLGSSNTVIFGRNRFRHLCFQPRRAGHGAVLVGDVDLQRQFAPLRDRLDAADDIGDRELAVNPPHRMSSVNAVPGITLVAPGSAVMAPTVPTSPAPSALQTPRPRRCIRRHPQRVAPQRHRHRAAWPCRRGSPPAAWRRRWPSPRRAGRFCCSSTGPCSMCSSAYACSSRRLRAAAPMGWSPNCTMASLMVRPLNRAHRRAFVEGAIARLPSKVEANRTPASSAKPTTSIANGKRTPRRFRSATQAIAVMIPSGPSRFCRRVAHGVVMRTHRPGDPGRLPW